MILRLCYSNESIYLLLIGIGSRWPSCGQYTLITCWCTKAIYSPTVGLFITSLVTMSLSKPRDDNIIEKAVKAYAALLHKRPVLTKSVTSACTSGLGNLLSQLIAQHGRPIQWRSVAAFAATGLIFVGPAIHYFLIWMDKVVPRSEKYSNLKRIILDRLIFAPPFLLIYFYLVAIFEGQSSKEAFKKIQQFFWPILIMNWKIWTPLQYININYVPREVLFPHTRSLVQHTLLLVAVVAVNWGRSLAKAIIVATKKAKLSTHMQICQECR